MQPPVRSAVSSTELLYERAMVKFYQAVAKEEAIEQDKLVCHTKILPTMEYDNSERRKSFPEQKIIRTKRNSLQEDKRLAIKKLLSSENILKQSKSGEKLLAAVDKPAEISLDRSQIKQVKIAEDVQIVNEEEEAYSSDYTDSTVSSNDSIVVKMATLKERLSRVDYYDDDESKTYHPRSIDIRTLTSPYKLPEHGQAVNILSKPHPLPDPSFIPKPILKRPTSPTSTSINISSSSNVSPISLIHSSPIAKIRPLSPPPPKTTGSPLMKPPPSKQIENSSGAKRTIEEREHVSKKQKKGIKKFLQKIASSPLSSKEKLNMRHKQDFIMEFKSDLFPFKHEQVTRPISSDALEPFIGIIPTRPQIIPSNEHGRKLLHQRQNSEEENKTVIDHYTNILKDHNSVRLGNDKIPIYLNPEAIKKVHEKAKEEGVDIDLEEEHRKPSVYQGKRELDLNALTFVRRQRSRDSSLTRGPPQLMEQSLSQNPIKDQFSATIVLKSNSLPKNSKEEYLPKRSMSESRNTLPLRQRYLSLPTKGLKLDDVTTSSFQNSLPPATEQFSRNGIRMSQGYEIDVEINNKSDHEKVLQYSRSETGSQMSTRSKTPEELIVEDKIKSNLTYVMDVCLLGFSFYLYICKDPIFCIPILILLVYRQLGDIIINIPTLKPKES